MTLDRLTKVPGSALTKAQVTASSVVAQTHVIAVVSPQCKDQSRSSVV
jgi:hypothetical protein